MANYTVPGINENDAKQLIDGLQERLTDYNDLHLILKHVHWNVTGPNFIAVHEMLDPQVDLVRGYADEVAERISTLGGAPVGTPEATLLTAPHCNMSAMPEMSKHTSLTSIACTPKC